MAKATREELTRSGEEFTSLKQGFNLIQARLERTLQRHDIHRIDAPDGTVDPTRMTVVELVDDDAPPETVVDVVRPGYRFGEHVVRFAEVRAVASRAATTIDVDGDTDGDGDGGDYTAGKDATTT